ncbi:hypothetical protein NC651_035868 [Populus alba x Populus x berolinensis]|nr:hypothetical protein NC651_035868 [Populus alba x Populus x berolinensis]
MKAELKSAELVLPTHSVSRGYRYMKNTQKDNQEAVGNTLSKFFKLKIIRIALLMNPTMLILSHHPPCTHLLAGLLYHAVDRFLNCA